MISARMIAVALEELGITHVVYLPDATTGQWEPALESASFRLIRVCREGEAWPLAVGLKLAGAAPLVVMQSTGLFESGDALRNAVYDLEQPLYALIGYRSYLVDTSSDTAKKFTEPILEAWGLDHTLVADDDDLPRLVQHYRDCQAAGRAGVTLIAEGPM